MWYSKELDMEFPIATRILFQPLPPPPPKPLSNEQRLIMHREWLELEDLENSGQIYKDESVRVYIDRNRRTSARSNARIKERKNA